MIKFLKHISSLDFNQSMQYRTNMEMLLGYATESPSTLTIDATARRAFSRKPVDNSNKLPVPKHNYVPGGGGGVLPYIGILQWVCAARETPIFNPKFPFRSI